MNTPEEYGSPALSHPMLSSRAERSGVERPCVCFALAKGQVFELFFDT